MEIVILPGPAACGTYAAGVIMQAIRDKPAMALGVATGSSPLAAYAELAAMGRNGLDMGELSAFALDEYVGLETEHPQSYHSVIHREVTQPLRLDASKVHVPNGTAADLQAACTTYEQAIVNSGGIELQLLGIGANGHIGFNEPGSSLASRTRIKTLSPRTRADNARFFDEGSAHVPAHCITQGIRTILEARSLLLVATGAGKARAVGQMIEGPIGAFCPATALQLHPQATIVVDEEAAAGLRGRDYYDHTFTNKPAWQRIREYVQSPDNGALKA